VFRSLVIILFFFGGAGSISAQPKAPKPALELTAVIVSQTYCAVTADSSSLQLTLKVQYRNGGSERLILYKGHDLFFQTRIRSAPGNPAGPYEVWVLNSRYFDGEFEAIDEVSPGRVFTILPPGSVYQREIVIGVGLVGGKAERGDSAINAGDHTLHLSVSTWYKSPSLAQKLRQQWQRKGLLWSDPLGSPPIRFTARRPGLIAPCR
jgi:hypothetical protein